MTAGQRPVLLTFDTNLAGVRGPRAFWATLCEEIGQPLALTPTAASETLRRVRLETEREWTRKLKAIDREQGIGWSRTQLRRLATTAANASRDWLNEEIRKQGGVYTFTRRDAGEIEDREAEIDDAMDDRAFDLTTDNGIRDRKITIEAMARGYDILASNNVESIDHGLLRHWIEEGAGRMLGVRTTILRPEPAEERIRREHGKPIEWTVHAAARACVSNPENARQAAREIMELIEGFHERGMSELQRRIQRLTRSASDFAAALESVRRHGASGAMRGETKMQAASAAAVVRTSGRDIGL